MKLQEKFSRPKPVLKETRVSVLETALALNMRGLRFRSNEDNSYRIINNDYQVVGVAEDFSQLVQFAYEE